MYFIEHHAFFTRLDQYPYVYNSLIQYPDVKVKKAVHELSTAALITIDLSEYHPQMDEIITIMEKYKLDKDSNTLYYSYRCYSSEDYASADWFFVYSHFMSLKTQPLNQYYRETCQVEELDKYMRKRAGFHAAHQNDVITRSAINWRNKFFASCTSNQNILFCREKAKQILEQNSIKGIDYIPVIKQSTHAPLEDMYHIVGSAPFPNSAIVVLLGMQETYCPICKERIVIWSGNKSHFGIKKGALDSNVDFYVTPPMFSSPRKDPSEAIGKPINIISKRMYHILKDNDMARSLAMEPLPTVEI